MFLSSSLCFSSSFVLLFFSLSYCCAALGKMYDVYVAVWVLLCLHILFCFCVYLFVYPICGLRSSVLYVYFVLFVCLFGFARFVDMFVLMHWRWFLIVVCFLHFCVVVVLFRLVFCVEDGNGRPLKWAGQTHAGLRWPKTRMLKMAQNTDAWDGPKHGCFRWPNTRMLEMTPNTKDGNGRPLKWADQTHGCLRWPKTRMLKMAQNTDA